MNTIIVAVDGSQHAKKALEITALLAKSSNSEVVVIHAVGAYVLPDEIRKGLEVEYADEIASRLKSANLISPLPDETQYARTLLSHSNKINQVVNTVAGENILKIAASFLSASAVAKVSAILVKNDAADAIIDAYEKYDADTIVMGCRGTGKLRSFVLGSVSQSVAHRAPCSVVIVK